MKLNLELLALEPLLSNVGQHMSPPSLPPRNNFKSAVAVDMPGDYMYSPILKSSKSEQAVSRIHCIPLLMLLVFFILWAASSEVLPSVKTDVRIATATQVVTSELELKMVEIDSQPGSRTMLHQHDSSHSNDPAALRNRAQDNLPENVHLRGNAWSATAR